MKDKIRAAAVASGILKENVEDVITLTADRFDLRDDEIVVLDEDGELSADSVGSFFTKTFKAARPIYYEPSAGPGTGAPPTGQKTSAKGTIVLSYDDAANPQKYRAAKAEAEKRGVTLEVEERVFIDPAVV